LPFEVALEQYRTDREPYLALTTRRSELDHAKPLGEFFRGKRVNQITEGMIRDYISARSKAGRANAKINKEMGILVGMLRRAKRWHLFSEDIKRLKVRKSMIARVISEEEKLRLLRISAGNGDWNRARLAMLLALNTTMRSGEVRGLQWRDIDWLEKTVKVSRAKTEEGIRDIPLNREAYDVVSELRRQANEALGPSLSPNWFVFFSWTPGAGAEPTRAVKGWRSAWRSMTTAIECPECGKIQAPGKSCACGADIHEVKSPTAGLRFHDLRHCAITNLSEGQASDETIMSIAGHIDRRMMSHYSHIRIAARRKAVEALCDGQTHHNSQHN
jgi:integrase